MEREPLTVEAEAALRGWITDPATAPTPNECVRLVPALLATLDRDRATPAPPEAESGLRAALIALSGAVSRYIVAVTRSAVGGETPEAVQAAYQVMYDAVPIAAAALASTVPSEAPLDVDRLGRALAGRFSGRWNDGAVAEIASDLAARYLALAAALGEPST